MAIKKQISRALTLQADQQSVKEYHHPVSTFLEGYRALLRKKPFTGKYDLCKTLDVLSSGSQKAAKLLHTHVRADALTLPNKVLVLYFQGL